MPRATATAVTLLTLTLFWLFAPTPAGAVVKGTPSSLGSYTVRLVGPHYCTGVVIGRRLVVTAAHCARRNMRILDGGSAGIADISRSAVLDDGRRVSVAGDAAILRLTAPLSASAAPIGNGGGDTFTIAGYGTTDERASGAFGALHEASLIAAPGRQLVDPHRSGAISASACFGDSGGPVMRGGMLVGIITRANYPNKRIACGFYTRWAPVTVHGETVAVASYETAADEPAPRRAKRQRHTKRAKEAETQSFNLFASWFAPKVEQRRLPRRKQANAHLSQQEPAYRPMGLAE